MDLSNSFEKKNRVNASLVQVFSIFLFILLFANLYKHINGSNFQINDFLMLLLGLEIIFGIDIGL